MIFYKLSEHPAVCIEVVSARMEILWQVQA